MIDNEISKQFDRRSALFLSGGVILTSVLILRMLQMQIFNYRDYKKKSENNSFRIQINMPERGKILSRNGLPISYDAPIYRLYVIPEETTDLEGVIKTLSRELDLSDKRVKNIWKHINKQPKFQPVLISENTDWNTLAGIQAKNLNGVHIQDGYARHYEMGPAGAQIFGYVGAPENPVPNTPFYTRGVTGLEKVFNESLAGTPGKTVMITNAVGRVTGEDKTKFEQSIPGQDIQTTINESAQRVLHDSLTTYKSGCGVALDIETGDILAIASTPSFDPNNFSGDDAEDYLAGLRSNFAKPFMNKVFEGLYPPGSTFKIIVALAGLESGAITPNETVFCPGYWEYGDRRYHCWEHRGHGHVNVITALKHSCDIYFYQMALRIGIDAIKQMAIKLGLTDKYIEDIISKQMTGIIPDRKWKETNKGAKWVHGDTVISGIGQGFILVNCMQLAVMMARVASNKRVVPRFIKSNQIPKFESMGIQKKNLNYVLNGLEEVLKPGGTAAGSAINVDGAKMGGKTGTSQVRSISKAERMSGVLTNEQLEWNMRNHGLFVGYAPTTNPKYAVCVITEHSGSSGSAARSVAAVMKELLKK